MCAILKLYSRLKVGIIIFLYYEKSFKSSCEVLALEAFVAWRSAFFIRCMVDPFYWPGIFRFKSYDVALARIAFSDIVPCAKT